MWILRLFFVTVVILAIQSWIYKRWGYKKISYRRSFNTSAVFEGGSVEMVERIANAKLLPVPWLQIESRIHPSLEFQKKFNLDVKHGQFHKSLFSLMPFMQITRRHKVRCTKRGYYNLKSVAMTSGDLFGSSSDRYRTFEVDAGLYVYPRLIRLKDIPLPSHSWQGDIVVRRWIVDDPFMICGVRDYRYGDSMNCINWKATAKTGDLRVHKYDYTASSRLMILMNIDLKEDQWTYASDTGPVETGISYAASIMQHAVLNGVETGFGSNGYLREEEKKKVYIPPRCSRAHMITLFNAMAALVIMRSISFHSFLEEAVYMEETNMDILIISAYVSDLMEEQIIKLRNQGNAVEILWTEGEGINCG